MIVSLWRLDPEAYSDQPERWLFVSPDGEAELTDPFPSRDAALEHAALRMWTTVPLDDPF